MIVEAADDVRREGHRIMVDQSDYSHLHGAKGPERLADVETSSALAQIFCAAIEDGNPKYWDEEYAVGRWGGLVMPIALLSTIGFRLSWTPAGENENKHLSVSLPIEGETIINASSETEYLRPLREGELLHSYDEVADISLEKQTRLGRGRFITTKTTYKSQDGETVAVNMNIVFKFFPK